MVKLAKYLKPYILPIVFCVALLFGQAMCELNLPNMMSNIVNVGIQQSGIEDKAPRAVSTEGLDLLKVFMSEADQSVMEDAYTLVSAGAQQYQSEYPLVKEKDIYVMKDGVDVEAAGQAYGRSIMALLNFMQTQAAEHGGASSMGDGQASLEAVDLSELYQLTPMLRQMPREAFAGAIEAASKTDSGMLEQTGVAMTGVFYNELLMDTGNMRFQYILRTGLLMLLLTLLSAASTIGVGFLASRVAAGVARTLRRDVFCKVENFSNAEFDEFSTASLITRTTNDITQVQMLLVMGLRMVCYAPIIGAGGVVMAVSKSTSMTWIIALGVALLIGLVLVTFSIVMPRFKIVQKLVDRLNLVTRENLSGMMVIRAFGTERFEEKRFERANHDLTRNNLFIGRATAFMMPTMMFMMNGVSLLIVWVGAHQIEQSSMQVGDMMAFMQYAMQIIMAFLMISMMFIMVPRASVSGARVAEVLAVKPSIVDPNKPKQIKKHPAGKVEFCDVSFRYSNAENDVLEDISFTANPGQTTAFIGSTGSGKSTLINLIPRFYDVTKGKILIDGVDVRELPQHDLRNIIGYVPQKGVLFSGDIRGNLRYGSEKATEEQIRASAEIAQAAEFIDSMPQGMDTPISQGGSNVSGGQKQRLSIGRALTKNAPIYIFDDSFSALDFKTDAALRRALKERTGESTVLIVAQRVSTIMQADQIIVLDEGRIVGKGTHRELLKSCPTYREIAESQLSEEELQ